MNVSLGIKEEIAKLYNRRAEVRASLLSLINDDRSIAYEDGLGASTRLLVELHNINAALNDFEVL